MNLVAHYTTGLSEEIIEGVQALNIEFPAEILAGRIVPFSDDRHAGYNFRVQFPGALPVVFAQLGSKLNNTQVKFE